jgi:ABC-type multidrug transport system fused ATPase/permease subunit
MMRIPGAAIYRKYKARFIGLFFLSLIANAAEALSIGALVPFLSLALNTDPLAASNGTLINAMVAFLKHFEYKNIFVTTCLLFFFLILLKVISTGLRDILKNELAQRIRFDAKKALFNKYLYSDLKVFLHNKGGDMIYRCINLPDELSMYFGFLPSMLMETITVVALCALLITISLPLFGGMVAVGILYAGIIMLLSRRVFLQIGERVRDTSIGQNVTAHEAVSGIREIITYDKRDKWFERFKNDGEKLYILKLKSNVVRLLPNSLLELMLAAAICAGGVYFGLYRMNELSHMLPVLTVYLLAMARMVPSFGKIGQDKIQATTYLASVVMYERLLNEQTHAWQGGKKEFAGFNDCICLENLHFSYQPGREVLKGIDLIVPKNKTVAIVSGSGGGKSTLMDLLLGFYNFDQGRILVDGVDLREYDILSWRRHIGMVSQHSFIFHASVKENIAFDTENIDTEKIIQAAKAAGAHEFISHLKDGYDTVLGDRGYNLSGGQRQRIAIARAIYRDPDIIILDEATSAMDNRTEQMITETVDSLSKNKTLIILAHRLSTIKNADIIYVLKDGKVTQAGTFVDLQGQDGEFNYLYREEKA